MDDQTRISPRMLAIQQVASNQNRGFRAVMVPIFAAEGAWALHGAMLLHEPLEYIAAAILLVATVFYTWMTVVALRAVSSLKGTQ